MRKSSSSRWAAWSSARFLATQLARDFDADAASFGRAPISLGHNVGSKGEVDRLIEAAVASGATLLKQPHDAVWGGYSGYFADPDGFAWEIAWNPASKLGTDGSLRFQ